MFFLKELPSRQMIQGYAGRIEGVDPAAVETALRLMRDVSRLIRKLEAYFSQHDLSQLRFLAMMVIDREPERDYLTSGEISERLDVSKPVTTRTLRTLESAALIDITQDRADARSRHVRLTGAGHAKLAQILPGYFAILTTVPRDGRAWE